MKTAQLKFSTLFALLMVFSIGFYSCQDDPDESDNTNGSQQDRDFAARASQSNMAEIQFGQLAVERGQNDSIILFAEEMIDDHRTAQTQLDSVARRMNLALPDSMNAAHRTFYSFLSRLNDFEFDSAYIHNQVIDHQNTRDLLQKQIDDGDDSSLVNYARRLLPIVIRHHETAIKLRTTVNEEGR